MRQNSADLTRSAFASSATSKTKRDSGSLKRIGDGSRRSVGVSKRSRGDSKS